MSGIFPGKGGQGAGPPNYGLIVVFDTVATVSAFTMLITVIPAVLNPQIHRSKPWFIMITTLAVFPLLYLWNAGSQFRFGVAPPFGMCNFQAALIYAGPPSGCACVFGYIADVALGLHAVISKKKWNPMITTILLYTPLMLFAIVFLISIIIIDPTTIQFDSAHMFCGAGDGASHTLLSAILSILMLFLMLCAEVWIVVLLYRNWGSFRAYTKTHNDMRVSILIRLALFTVGIGGGGTLAAFLLPENSATGAIWNICLVSVPFLAGLAFGTHQDIIGTWVSWILRRPINQAVKESYEQQR